MQSSLFTLATTLFLVANPIGNSPAIVALIKDFDFECQKRIMLRETLFSFLIAIFFQLIGGSFLDFINVKQYSLSICGGILLFLVALNMIFPRKNEGKQGEVKQEPFFVPIATPIITGPGLMAMIMVFTRQEQNNIKVLSAICIAWVGVAIVLFLAPYLKKLVGEKGLLALETLMGMVLAMISMQMIVSGAALFWSTCCEGV